jgi:hypothetical protein
MTLCALLLAPVACGPRYNDELNDDLLRAVVDFDADRRVFPIGEGLYSGVTARRIENGWRRGLRARGSVDLFTSF